MSSRLPASLRAVDLRADYQARAFGIGSAAPALSWRALTELPAWQQQRYQLELQIAGQPTVRSDEIESSESAFVDWPFASLPSRQQLALRVRIWGKDGSASDWSEPLAIETGLLVPADWSARFISPDWDEDIGAPQPAPLLRHGFQVGAGLVQARLYVSALGCYEANLNGKVVGDEVLAPGWTSYSHRLRYQTHDVTAQMREGENVLAARLGDGWYRGRLGFSGGSRNHFGERLALLAQLELRYADGRIERVISDADWRASTGGLRSSDIYDGERYDARLEPAGWLQPGFDARGWVGVRLLERDLSTLVAPDGPPMRRIETRRPIAITTSPSGKTILDFGQNLVGWLRLSGMQGPRGREITLRHAEVLQDGELCTEPLRHAASTDRYVLSGEGASETWEPRFTFHGFRYAQIDGWPGELSTDQVEAVVVHSDMERSGWFECSDPLVNQLHENAVWSMRGNFLDVPTDCPQRDERLGWTGDLQVFAPTAAFLYDVNGFLGSWLQDLAAEQKAKKVVPFVVPDVTRMPNPPSAAWGDAASMVPWVLYERSGDKDVLKRQYPSMKAWVEQVADVAGEAGLWNRGYQFGDWLDPTAPHDNPSASKTHPHVLATAHLVRSARVTARAARLLGLDEDAQHFEALVTRVTAAFRDQYVAPNGWIIGDSITSYAMALVFDLLDERQRRGAGARMVELVAESRFRIATGFVGTPLICDALVQAGATDTAYKLLMQRECPSWLYPVTQGATTIWERWDSLMPNGRVNPGGMTSFNHYAFGAVADWLHRSVAGLAPSEPGYRRLRVEPLPGGGLTLAQASHLTPYGRASVAWRLEGAELVVDVVVPPNCHADVRLPGQAAAEVGSGQHHWRVPFAVASRALLSLSIDNTMAELMADEEAWKAVKSTMVRVMPELAAHFDHSTGQGQQGMGATSLASSLSLIPQSFGMIEAVTQTLDALNVERGLA